MALQNLFVNSGSNDSLVLSGIQAFDDIAVLFEGLCWPWFDVEQIGEMRVDQLAEDTDREQEAYP